MKGVIARLSLFAFAFGIALLPYMAYAQVANFVFTSDPQTVQPGVPSGQITIQAQDSDGTSVNIPSTACIAFSSTSVEGQFSSNSAKWNPASVLTMSKNTANKNFYYKDGQTGAPILTAKVALKPDSVTGSCAGWPMSQWTIQWTATQAISIGTATVSGSPTASAPAPASQITSVTPTQPKTKATIAKRTAKSRSASADARDPGTSSYASEPAAGDGSGNSVGSTTASADETAAAGAAGGGWSPWWIAAIGLSVAAAGALIAAQYFGKSEWDIIEEKPEAE